MNARRLMAMLAIVALLAAGCGRADEGEAPGGESPAGQAVSRPTMRKRARATAIRRKLGLSFRSTDVPPDLLK
jgi:hypothetical protein